MEECVMKKYMNPEMEVVRFNVVDVLSASGTFVGGNGGTDDDPESDDIVSDFGDLFNP